MRKLIIVLLVVFCQVSFGQVYQLMPQYGYSAPRINIDSTLTIPTFNGVPTLKSNIIKKGALAIDSTNGRFYFYNPKTLVWDTIKGGGGSTDTTSLSNRINTKLNIVDTTDKWVNSITRTIGKDSIIYFVGSTRYAIKDSVGTNPAPVGYYGAFSDTLNQPIVSTTIAYPMNFRVTDLSNGVSVVNNNRILFANAGIYNIQFSAQFTNSSTSSECAISIWLRKNGVDIPGSTGYIQLPKKGSGQDGEVLPAWNFVLSMASGDSLVWYWRADNTTASITTFPAGINPTRPSTASAIVTVTQQSGIMAGTGISPLDTANMLSPYARTSVVNSSLATKLNSADTLSLSNRINVKLNASDTLSLSNRINTKLNSSDTSSLSNRINTKVNLSDTSLFQRKSIDAYSFQANNTNATANVTSFTFREQASQTLSSGITWNGTAPSGTTNHQYRWNRIGNLVTLYITLVYTTAGANNTQVTIVLPADLPTPFSPTGLTAASDVLYSGSAIVSATTNTIITTARTCMLRRNVANNGFEVIATAPTAGQRFVSITIQYLTN